MPLLPPLVAALLAGVIVRSTPIGNPVWLGLGLWVVLTAFLWGANPRQVKTVSTAHGCSFLILAAALGFAGAIGLRALLPEVQAHGSYDFRELEAMLMTWLALTLASWLRLCTWRAPRPPRGD